MVLSPLMYLVFFSLSLLPIDYRVRSHSCRTVFLSWQPPSSPCFPYLYGLIPHCFWVCSSLESRYHRSMRWDLLWLCSMWSHRRGICCAQRSPKENRPPNVLEIWRGDLDGPCDTLSRWMGVWGPVKQYKLPWCLNKVVSHRTCSVDSWLMGIFVTAAIQNRNSEKGANPRAGLTAELANRLDPSQSHCQKSVYTTAIIML